MARYIKENREIKYIGNEPRTLEELNDVLIGLFVELGFKREESSPEINFFFKKDLSICIYMKNDQFGITIPTKNQIMTSMKFYENNMNLSAIDLIIDVMKNQKTRFDLCRNPKISICNMILSFIRLLWYSSDKDLDEYILDVKTYIDKMS
jgi:hypothetical protein